MKFKRIEIVSHTIVVFGALLGTQEGRSMEILNSFELQYDIIDSDVVINTEYYHAKAEQCKRIKSTTISNSWSF